MTNANPVTRTVAVDEAGLRLDAFLAKQPEVGSRGYARQLLDGGRVTVGDAPARPSRVLTAGDVVNFAPHPARRADPLSPGLPLPELRILYEDAWLCAIDKPVGIAAHPPEDRSVRAHTVASWARERFGELPAAVDGRPGIVHRLDRDTSGVMVLAKTQAAFDDLRAQWKMRTVEKEYRCIVFGEPRFQSDWIERNIAPDPARPDRMIVVDEGGREASTYYEVAERFRGFAHVLCRPKTGRTHQIRVHMTAIGHSLVGDPVYRSRSRQHEALPDAAPDPRRQCLHARRLSLLHPETREPVAFEAPLPADLQDLLAWLRTHRDSSGPAR